MAKIYRRTKSRFTSARSAWMDVARKTGLRPNQVKAQHTMKQYVWKRK